MRIFATAAVAVAALFIVYIAATSVTCARGANLAATSILNGNESGFKDGYSMLSKCKKFAPVVEDLPKILGNNTYIVLLQNNWEIRPTGGFMGSYAVVKFQNNVLKDIQVQDIYIPDGQLPGHVNPPKPILQAFKTGFWKLRDANFDPDFQKSASDTAWFFEKGGVKDFDGIIALNFSTIRKILQITGPIELPDHNETLTADNFYEKAQSQAQVGFFPGSKNKFNFLSEASDVLINSLKSLSVLQKAKVAKLLFNNINSGEIMLWAKNADLNKIFLDNNWGGALKFPNQDFIYIVDTNLSANKSDCCVERSAQMKISQNTHELKIKYKNNSTASISNPPENWGGDYKNFIRIILPISAQIEKVVSGGSELEKTESEEDRPYELSEDKYYTLADKVDYKELSFWSFINANSESEVNVVYSTDKFGGEIYIKKQPGIEEFPFDLKVE